MLTPFENNWGFTARGVPRAALSPVTMFWSVAMLVTWGLLCAAEVGGDDSFAAILEEARKPENRAMVVGLRRKLHQHPELMFNEFKTSRVIQKTLKSLGIPFIPYFANTTGVVATIGDGSHPIIALRADMDALPVLEEADVAFRSRIPGRMHACGHDAHVAMLLAAAAFLQRRFLSPSSSSSSPPFPRGTVRLIFQPAEEGGAGGQLMVDGGALDDVDMAFALHVAPKLPVGFVGSRPGLLMAGSGSFSASIAGAGGHAAMPHLAVDPVLAAAHAVVGLQSVVARETDPFSSRVISVTLIHAGHAMNVIPSVAHIKGTYRATTRDDLAYLESRITEIVTAHAAAMRCTAVVEFGKKEMSSGKAAESEDAGKSAAGAGLKGQECSGADADVCEWQEDGENQEDLEISSPPPLPIFREQVPAYPPVINHESAYNVGLRAVKRLLGQEAFVEVPAWMAGEDFAFFQEKVPGALFFFGVGENGTDNPNLHSPLFKLDEDALPIGGALHVSLALEAMAGLSGKVDT